MINGYGFMALCGVVGIVCAIPSYGISLLLLPFGYAFVKYLW